jgi:hypothetical protein
MALARDSTTMKSSAIETSNLLDPSAKGSLIIRDTSHMVSGGNRMPNNSTFVHGQDSSGIMGVSHDPM